MNFLDQKAIGCYSGFSPLILYNYERMPKYTKFEVSVSTFINTVGL